MAESAEYHSEEEEEEEGSEYEYEDGDDGETAEYYSDDEYEEEGDREGGSDAGYSSAEGTSVASEASWERETRATRQVKEAKLFKIRGVNGADPEAAFFTKITPVSKEDAEKSNRKKICPGPPGAVKRP
jgi:hypothetical protein